MCDVWEEVGWFEGSYMDQKYVSRSGCYSKVELSSDVQYLVGLDVYGRSSGRGSSRRG